MRLCQFTPRQPAPDIRITPREWKPDLEVTIKHDELYARSRECDFEKLIFDSDYNNPVTPNSTEITIRSERAADETSTTPETIRESSSEIFPQADRSCGGTDTHHYMEPGVDTSLEQPDSTPTNPRSSKYDLRHNPTPNCKDDYRYWVRALLSTERICTIPGNSRNVLRN